MRRLLSQGGAVILPKFMANKVAVYTLAVSFHHIYKSSNTIDTLSCMPGSPLGSGLGPLNMVMLRSGPTQWLVYDIFRACYLNCVRVV